MMLIKQFKRKKKGRRKKEKTFGYLSYVGKQNSQSPWFMRVWCSGRKLGIPKHTIYDPFLNWALGLAQGLASLLGAKKGRKANLLTLSPPLFISPPHPCELDETRAGPGLTGSPIYQRLTSNCPSLNWVTQTYDAPM